MHYYNFKIGDYHKKTAHLTETEDLAYRRLLDFYYDTEKPIPNDPQSVARRVRMPTKSKIILSVLQEFFTLEDDGWHQSSCDEIIVKYHGFSEAGKIGAQAREAKKLNKSTKIDKPPLSHPYQTLEATKNQEPRTNIEPPIVPHKKEATNGRTKRPAQRAFPDDWKPHENHRAKCQQNGLDTDGQAESFRNHHLAKGTRFADWNAAFFTWIANAIKFGEGRKASGGFNGNHRQQPKSRAELTAEVIREMAQAKSDGQTGAIPDDGGEVFFGKLAI